MTFDSIITIIEEYSGTIAAIFAIVVPVSGYLFKKIFDRKNFSSQKLVRNRLKISGSIINGDIVGGDISKNN